MGWEPQQHSQWSQGNKNFMYRLSSQIPRRTFGDFPPKNKVLHVLFLLLLLFHWLYSCYKCATLFWVRSRIGAVRSQYAKFWVWGLKLTFGAWQGPTLWGGCTASRSASRFVCRTPCGGKGKQERERMWTSSHIMIVTSMTLLWIYSFLCKHIEVHMSI